MQNVRQKSLIVRSAAAQRISYVLSVIVLLLLATPITSHANELKLRLHLTGDEQRALLKQKSFSLSSRKVDSSDLQLDSAEDIILGSERRSRFYSYYKGLVYLKYFNDWTGIGNYDELESEQLAQSLFAYHGAKTVVDYLSVSPISNLYHDAMDKLRSYKQLTTVSVERQSAGDMKVAYGEDLADDPIIKFRLGISTKRGIEPRVRFGDDVTLRYDMLHRQTLLEYRIDF